LQADKSDTYMYTKMIFVRIPIYKKTLAAMLNVSSVMNSQTITETKDANPTKITKCSMNELIIATATVIGR